VTCGLNSYHSVVVAILPVFVTRQYPQSVNISGYNVFYWPP